MKKIFYYLTILLYLIILPVNAQVTDYEKLIGGNGEIYMSPVWSPDGSMIAFTSANYKGIYVLNLENRSVKQITDEDAAGFVINWSANSEYILSRVARFEGLRRYNAIKIFNIKTGEEKQLSDYRTMMPGIPQWANGGKDVFVYNTEKLELFPTGLTNSSKQTSEIIVYKRNGKIAVENLSTESLKIYEPVKDGEVLNLTISPDGKKAAFEIIGGNMYVMNVDGTGLTNLGKGYRPSWSPDSKTIYYMITEDDGHQILSSDIYSINIDGSGKRNITNTEDIKETNPEVSPDGKYIAFDILDEGAIYISKIQD